MRINIEFELDEKKAPVDYRRWFMSFIKSCFENNVRDFYNKIYENQEGYINNATKPFTFSVFLGSVKFEKDEIILEKNSIFLNFSSNDYEYAIHFFNSCMKSINKLFPLGMNNQMKLINIQMSKEKVFVNNSEIFKTMSPIIVRYHDKTDRNNSLDDYLKVGHENFEKQLKINIYEVMRQHIDLDDIQLTHDIQNMQFKILKMKSVPIVHFNERVKGRINGNIGIFKVEAKPYILDFIFKAGIGSRRSQGFGMLEIANERSDE